MKAFIFHRRFLQTRPFLMQVWDADFRTRHTTVGQKVRLRGMWFRNWKNQHRLCISVTFVAERSPSVSGAEVNTAGHELKRPSWRGKNRNTVADKHKTRTSVSMEQTISAQGIMNASALAATTCQSSETAVQLSTNFTHY